MVENRENRSPLTFGEIVRTLKADITLNIYELTYKLNCSDGVIYRRIVESETGIRGLSGLKQAIREGRI
ncbi:MAG: hypothetical protein HZC47_00995 [Methanobacterium sp.]|uniref:hypothetical protein n=1 Tax=Methanobacterium sp. TaxID=2164 RepID=UPI003D645CFF|nr:hypothetical protein [Methanobacterium sp.]